MKNENQFSQLTGSSSSRARDRGAWSRRVLSVAEIPSGAARVAPPRAFGSSRACSARAARASWRTASSSSNSLSLACQPAVQISRG